MFTVSEFLADTLLDDTCCSVLYSQGQYTTVTVCDTLYVIHRKGARYRRVQE